MNNPCESCRKKEYCKTDCKKAKQFKEDYVNKEVAKALMKSLLR